MTDGNDTLTTPATDTAAADAAAPQPPTLPPLDPTSEPVVELSTADPVPEED